MASADTDLSLASRAAWLSLIGGLTQGQIAERLGISPIKVHRLIALAQQSGLVKVFVEGEPAECLTLEDMLRRSFALDVCTVVPGLDDPFAAVGVAGARFLTQLLDQKPDRLIGVGHGRTLARVVDGMPRIPRPGMRAVSLIGCLTRRAAANPFDVIHRLVDRTGGEGYFLPVPFIADSAADKAVVMAQKGVRTVLDLAARAELVLIGIGELGPKAHHLQVGTITEDEYAELMALGAVGDIVGQFVDEAGQPVASELNARILGVGLDGLKGRSVVGIAGGVSKGEAILAALRTGVLTGLIIDEPTAKRVLSLAKTRRESVPEARPTLGQTAV